VQLDALNLFNSRSNQIGYLRGEPVPVADRHVHPIEPTAIWLTERVPTCLGNARLLQGFGCGRSCLALTHSSCFVLLDNDRENEASHG
jgi:hypothetical protein